MENSKKEVSVTKTAISEKILRLKKIATGISAGGPSPTLARPQAPFGAPKAY